MIILSLPVIQNGQMLVELKNCGVHLRSISQTYRLLVGSHILTYVLGAQKNRLIETVLLSTHNICFG